MKTVLYLEYSEERSAAQVLLAARDSASEALVCEVFSASFTVDKALQAIQQLYRTCYRPFDQQVYITSSSLGLGPTPSPALYSQAFYHSPASRDLAISHGFDPLPIAATQLSTISVVPATYPLIPELQGNIDANKGEKVVLTGPFAVLGPGELSLLTLCSLFSPQEIRIKAAKIRSLRWIREEIEAFARTIFPPETGITVETGDEKALELKSGTAIIRLEGEDEQRESSLEGTYDKAELETIWSRISEELAVETSLSAYWFTRLCALYSQPHRFYHTLTHILSIFRSAYAVFPSFSPFLSLSIWFHDAIYDPKAKDNEEKSADLLYTFGEETGLRERLEKPAEWILATKRHKERTGDWEEKVLMDLDLSVLGGEEEGYRRYRVGIYQEYAWVGEEEYRRQRPIVLNSFLSRSQLYYLPLFQSKWETQARFNLSNEINLLSNPSISLLL